LAVLCDDFASAFERRIPPPAKATPQMNNMIKAAELILKSFNG
jgi:hypothetical protein